MSGLRGLVVPDIHPVLQQINQLNMIYGLPPQGAMNLLKTSDAPKDTQEQDELGKMKDDGVHEAVSSEVFSSYQHREIVEGCQPHPGDIVESGSLAALIQPDIFYPLTDSIPEEVISNGKLSSLQLEGVLYACQQHLRVLPSGERSGFFVGDAAGVGKGRQISGIILDNFARGRVKHIWFSISSDLIVDARRDLTDIGCYVKVINGCQELDRETRVFGLTADFKEGVIFSTYSTLVSSVQTGGLFKSGSKRSRLQQLMDWCGGDKFDGCLIFDECHKAKNFFPGKEQASTKIASAVSTIQRMLPNARVVYCSATGVADVKNMAFMQRLGMWGPSAPFRSFENFLDSVNRKGLGMAEMLAMEMKTSGMYVSRGLSYRQAEFCSVEIPLTREQRKVYDVAAHVWNELKKALESAVVRTRYQGRVLWSQFWSSHQRFFKQLCMGMKVPTVIKECKQALENNCCVVIGLQTTGEASLESELKHKGSLSGFMSYCREILTRFISQYFPVKITDENKEEEVIDEWSMKARNMLLEFAGKIDLPDSPLDEIIDKLGGPSCVAEMTGRRGRIVRHSQSGAPEYELRGGADTQSGVESLNVQERNMFMEGKKLIAIISDAASTGISLHADQRVANQRRRVHITLELAWSADKAVQQLGRTHRSNQSSGPLYKLLTTDLGGERRFAAAVAKRLESLGALTKGDRRAASGANLSEFNFDTPYGRQALQTMYHNICVEKKVPEAILKRIQEDGKYTADDFNSLIQGCLVPMGLVDIESLRIGVQIKEKDVRDVSKFLNRILGLSCTKQNLLFKYFTECLDSIINNAKSEGRYNEGLLDITASSVEMVDEPKNVFMDLNKGHGITRLVEVKIDRGMAWEMAVVRLQNHSGKNDGFYISKREVWGKKLYLLATQKENSSHLFSIARPNTGLSQFEEEKTDLFQRYTPIATEKAEQGWRKQYENTQSQCVHGAACKHGRSCRVGVRCYHIHLLCGSILTIMPVLESTLNLFSSKLGLSKSESSIRVVRIKLNNGTRVVGIRYPLDLIPEVEKILEEQRRQEQLLQAATVQQGSQPSLPSGSVSQGDLPVKKVVVDPVTPVNPKCRARALRPPVTIKNFFKPENKGKSQEDESQGATSIVENDTACSENKSEITENKLGISSPSTQCKNSEVQPNRKRSAEGSLVRPVTKRAKQSSLLQMFDKSQERQKTEGNKKSRSCPICSHVFEAGSSNADINSHIDNCLIE